MPVFDSVTSTASAWCYAEADDLSVVVENMG
jgi:hypothetical protein